MLLFFLCFLWRNIPDFGEGWSLVRFYKPDCMLCNYISNLIKRSLKLISPKNEIKVVDINCEANTKYCKNKFNVRGVPNFLICNDKCKKSIIFYKGKKDSMTIANFISNLTGYELNDINIVLHPTPRKVMSTVDRGFCTAIFAYKARIPLFIEKTIKLFVENEEFVSYGLDKMYEPEALKVLNMSDFPSVLIYSLTGKKYINLNNTRNPVLLYSQIKEECFGSEREKLKEFVKQKSSGKNATIPSVFAKSWNDHLLVPYLRSLSGMERVSLKNYLYTIRENTKIKESEQILLRLVLLLSEISEEEQNDLLL